MNLGIHKLGMGNTILLTIVEGKIYNGEHKIFDSTLHKWGMEYTILQVLELILGTQYY